MNKNKKIKWPLWPRYDKKCETLVSKVVKANRIFNGPKVKEFEKKFQKFNDSNFAVAVGNGTQALHLALAAINVNHNDEVIVTNFSWISSASCILMQRARPVFCDIEKSTLGIDPDEIEKKITKKTKAIIVVHMYGIICKIKEIKKIAKKYRLKIIEDASHAHGATLNGNKAGNFGDIGIFSLHQRKNIPSGEGGIIVCKNKKIANTIYKLRSFGHPELSYNYRMSEFSAVLALYFLKKIDKENNTRQKNAEYLIRKLKKNKNIKFYYPDKNRKSSFYKLIINFNFKKKINLNYIVKKLNKTNIPVSRVYQPLNIHSHFNKKNLKKLNINADTNSIKYPVTYQVYNYKLLQIDINSLTKLHHLDYLAKHLENLKL